MLIAPGWVSTRSQPIAVEDVVAYLAAVIEEPATAGVTYEIGGPEVLTYREMLKQAAHVMGRHPRPLFTVPFLTPWLSGKGLRFVTDVDPDVGASLVESMGNEVVVHDDAITRLLPRQLLTFAEAARRALDEREAEQTRRRPATSARMTTAARVREVLGATPFVGPRPPEDAGDRRRRVAWSPGPPCSAPCSRRSP